MNYIKISFRKEESTVRGNIEDALEKMFGMTMPTRFAVGEHAWRPQMDIYETQEEILVIIDLAGVRMEDIHLEVGRKSLKIYGKREQKTLPGTSRYRLAEIAYGYFERQLTLPIAVNEGTVEATYKNGLLEVRMAKLPPARETTTKVVVTK